LEVLHKLLFYILTTFFFRLISPILRFLAAFYLMIHSIMTFLTRKKVHKGNNLKLDLAANVGGTSEAIMQPVHSIQEIKEKYPDCDGILLKGVVRAHKEVEFTDGFDTPKFEMVNN